MVRAISYILSLSSLWHLSISLVLQHNPLASPSSATASPQTSSPPLPLVIWHGLGDKYDAEGLTSVGDLAQETNPGTYIYYIRLDDDPSADRTATFLGNVTLQVQKVCDDFATHPVLSKAPQINALGFSQGGQFLRAYVERCNHPPVTNLVTFGSQHNGISDFQNCAVDDWVCQGARGLLRGNTWSDFVQRRLVPAQYYRDPEDMEPYLKSSNFLADVNNERKVKNTTYRENMKKLERFAMYVFSEDKTVVPKESGWFSEVNTTSGKVTKLQDRRMYVEDWLGLRWLDEESRLEFRHAPGKHMELSDELLIGVFKRYFRPRTKGGLGRDEHVQQEIEKVVAVQEEL
ncbi:MAG: hypothetical protein M1830_004667 [Pleopsidium flavum]|nr:MAG: hypothetical protein M1830_004667 [Pleopsidium flavum]